MTTIKPKRVVYFADNDNDGDCRKIMPSGSLTDILEENLVYSNKPLPKTGDRWIELVRLDDSEWTHSRESNWIVDRVEVYEPMDELSKFSLIAYCYCKYAPIKSELSAIVDGDRNGTFYDQLKPKQELLPI
ncbi:hypothetical protein APA_3427 [Pseudanabaena sp. lw0831]|uniref:hypothetical protein n=1 Tax=Pseudanabaena sp. lw0831 TaxID=1357935 RepID=UPI00191510F0|nr:hypothetical protein [Pseudanabaena sp. lw0831]GBO55377.1 hypothetical protein APA_3427 [Pseudanabaena sp. lw0831]